MNKQHKIDNTTTIIIIDWDDTLYPTSWSLKNNISLTNGINTYFEKLDEHVSSLLKIILSYGEIIIVTNAIASWVHTTLTVMPKTKKILNNINIISARDRYQYIANIDDWKKYTFLEEVNKRYYINNIVSVGDAEYEYNALINLYNVNTNRYLKAIKFIKTTDYDIFIEQLILLKQYIQYFCITPKHIDTCVCYDSNMF